MEPPCPSPLVRDGSAVSIGTTCQRPLRGTKRRERAITNGLLCGILPCARRGSMESLEPLRPYVVEVLQGAERPLLAREIVSMLAGKAKQATRSEVNSVLYRGLGSDFERDSSFCWSLRPGAANDMSVSKAQSSAAKQTRRRWTEDETVLAYWALPLLREVSALAGRDFSAMAMKMANLLSVETDSREGLANASRLDRVVVQKYSSNRERLQERVAQIMSSGEISHSRADEVGLKAVAVLQRTKVPLHHEAVERLIVADDPLATVTTSLVREALAKAPSVKEGPDGVFRWVGDGTR